MRRVLVSVLLASTMVAAQGGDPVVGNWRGTLTSATGVESPIIITIVKKGDGYAGSTNGLNASSEAALKQVTVNGAVLSIEAADESSSARLHSPPASRRRTALKAPAVGRITKFDATLSSGGHEPSSRTSNGESTTSSGAGVRCVGADTAAQPRRPIGYDDGE
jgi:hypothetical protein